MADRTQVEQLEVQIAEWRASVAGGPAVDGRDVDELEAHLRDEIAELRGVGLAPDEAFLVAVKRLGALDDLSQAFASEHRGRLWKQLVVAGPDDQDETARRWPEAVAFAVAAAVVVQAVRLLADFPDEEPSWLFRNVGLLVLPFLAAWFGRRRRLTLRQWGIGGAAFAMAAVVVNVQPYDPDATTEALAIAHLPVVLWFAVAYAYTGGEVGSHERRMDFVRFTGEWCIYLALLALGGGVLTALTIGILEPAGVDPDELAAWILPSGAAGAVVVAAWLVESKQRVVENMAPVLTAVFTPLFALMLAVAAVVYAATGLGDAFDRELIGIFDALLVVVLGLVLYGLSAREASPAPGWTDRIQLVAVAAALVLDVLVLVSMVDRVADEGFTPNRAAALGLNLVLLVDLAGSARHAWRFVSGRGTFHRLERWHTAYLPVFALWAAAVVAVFPPLLAFE